MIFINKTLVLATICLLTGCGGDGSQVVVSHSAVQETTPVKCNIAPPSKVRLETDQNLPIISKEDYLSAQITVDDSGGFGPYAASAEIRGRGNSTWNMPKKSYRLRLKDKASLLGMPSHRSWALLANYSDKTMLRNAVAFCMGNMLGMSYVPRNQYVELTLNGVYTGVYQLTEHITTGKNRVNVGEEDGTAASGYLIEIDARLDGSAAFRSAIGTPIVVKSDTTPDLTNAIAKDVDAFEAALFGPDFLDAEKGYAKHVDMNALASFYVINEFMKNNDAFFSSTYVYKERGGKLVFGPLWDFDIAAGNINYSIGNHLPEGPWLSTSIPYIARLTADPVFRSKVSEKWSILSERMPDLMTFIDDSALTLDAAQQRNFRVWDILNTFVWPNPVVMGSYSGEVKYLEGWLTKRAAWMDSSMKAN